VVGETLTHASTNFQSVLWQRISVLDHHRFPQKVQECCRLFATMNEVHGTYEFRDIRTKSFTCKHFLRRIFTALTVSEMASHSSFGICLDHNFLGNCKSRCNHPLKRHTSANSVQCFAHSPMPHPSPSL
jgi:hypothetical protein